MSPWLASLGLAAAAATTSACASQNAIVRQYQQMRPELLRGDFSGAAAELAASKGEAYKVRDRVPYLLNLGTLQHYAGEYEASMDSLIEAEGEMRVLWTKSISGEVSRFVVNETSVAYAGADFERILVYLYTALNRVAQGRIQDALVEARRADEELQRMKIAYEGEEGLGTVYTQDAFMLWLVGLFYEIEGSYEDARLAYEASVQAYREVYGRFGTGAPSYLTEDLRRAAWLAGRELGPRPKGETDSAQAWGEGWAELILIHGNGEAPQKVEESLTVPTLDGYLVRVALPRFVIRAPRVRGLRVEASGLSARGFEAEPVSRIAEAQFEAQRPAIVARAVARAAIKYAATKTAERAVGGGRDASSERQVAGALVGLLANIAFAANESADLRAWTTLPSEFLVARLWLPPGRHELTIDFLGSGGSVARPGQRVEVELQSRERRILSVRSIR